MHTKAFPYREPWETCWHEVVPYSWRSMLPCELTEALGLISDTLVRAHTHTPLTYLSHTPLSLTHPSMLLSLCIFFKPFGFATSSRTAFSLPRHPLWESAYTFGSSGGTQSTQPFQVFKGTFESLIRGLTAQGDGKAPSLGSCGPALLPGPGPKSLFSLFRTAALPQGYLSNCVCFGQGEMSSLPHSPCFPL